MKRIIVPLDFSNESMFGLDLGILYANAFRSDLQIVHVLPKHSDEATKNKIASEIVSKRLNKIINEYKSKLFQECDFSFIVKSGRVFEEVVNQVEAFKDSMVICSTHGESGFSNLFMGSNAYRIIQATQRPVLSVTDDSFKKTIKTIVMPLDITNETREKAPLVAFIAKAFDAEVHIVKVSSSTNEGIHNKLDLYGRQITKYFDEQGIRYQKSLLVGDNITEITIDYAKTIDADLIAIMTEQNTSLVNMLLGSYAQQMLHASTIPVLSVTPKGLFKMYSFDTGG